MAMAPIMINHIYRMLIASLPALTPSGSARVEPGVGQVPSRARGAARRPRHREQGAGSTAPLAGL